VKLLAALLQSAVESARAELTALMDAAEAEGSAQTERYFGLRHSLHVIRTFPDVRQALRQLNGHAEFASFKPKADAYREAFAILTRHTGETPLETKPKHDPEDIPCLF
jgi:hypothetical protein